MKDYKNLYVDLTEPSESLITDISNMEGDILILGAGGKMGPALSRLAKKAVDKSGVQRKVTAVSRFSEVGLQKELNQEGIETIAADLLNEVQLQALPNARNVIFLAGMKFGTTGNEAHTWAMNTYLPGRVAEMYRYSKIVAFSTGNVYPLTDVLLGGSIETDSCGPVGEYAQSCLGRERIFQYFSLKYNIPMAIYRLNYANDATYGVLVEIACAVKEKRPIDLSMGNINVIWQCDANEIALRSFAYCSSPAKIINVTGPETVSIRRVAEQFGKLFGNEPDFTNKEQPTALLSNAGESFHLFGYPKTTLNQMIELIGGLINDRGAIIKKETHFQERNGKY